MEIQQPHAPGPAFFPAVMYCFATIDYFSGFWAGWNQSGPGKNQTDRMIDFLDRYLLYPRKESQLAVHFWRHKLMHTSEPRKLHNADNNEVYVWRTGTGLEHHMELAPLEGQEFCLDLDPLTFVGDLRTGIFGPSGYFQELRGYADLQAKYLTCLCELESYRVKLKP
ncbi:MAG: hypothetical protein HY268_26710 [Deltaproteobacteria bacterium]|nr:hypothetical protein [Deltaproteobacteria bacterium]